MNDHNKKYIYSEKEKNDMNINKNKLNGYNYINNFIENKKYNIMLNKIFIIYFYDIVLKIIFFSQFIQCEQIINELTNSYIYLKVKGKTNIKIFNERNGLNMIIINNTTKYTGDGLKNQYNFDNNINNITLIWNTTPISTKNLFKDCKDITEIDLSNFDSSQVDNMESMFYKCSNLISLDLSNFNTSSVTSMGGMFYDSSNLISLDLSNFNTSSVINMGSIFYQCSKLNTLDLSSFNTSSVTTMSSMFSG